MSELTQEMLREAERRGLDGEVLLRWAAWRVSHGGVRDASERFLMMMADLEDLARIRVTDRRLISEAIAGCAHSTQRRVIVAGL